MKHGIISLITFLFILFGLNSLSYGIEKEIVPTNTALKMLELRDKNGKLEGCGIRIFASDKVNRLLLMHYFLMTPLMDPRMGIVESFLLLSHNFKIGVKFEGEEFMFKTNSSLDELENKKYGKCLNELKEREKNN